MKVVSTKVTASILSMSLLTVMAGAAIAPALGIIKSHFSTASDLQMQFLISLPALFIILTNLAFPYICRILKTKKIAIIGLLSYVFFGTIPFFIDEISIILIFRALFGVSVGIIMPLSTGLISFYFPPQQQSELMGFSAAMNQLGGIVATLLAGILASISWNYAFLVYLLGLIAIIFIAVALPDEKLGTSLKNHDKVENLLRFHPSVVGMFLLMSLFFVFPSNFAIITSITTDLSSNQITLIMVGLDIIAFFAGIFFYSAMKYFRRTMKYFAPISFIIGYSLYSISSVSIAMIICGSIFIGIATGLGVPYLNTIASIKGGKNAALTVMPLISASLYIGQFLSPLYISNLGNLMFSGDIKGPYYFSIIISVLYLIQVYTTRNFQALPPPEPTKSIR